MRFFNRFPYTNINAINLDWMIDIIKQAEEMLTNADSRITAAQETADTALASAETNAADLNDLAVGVADLKSNAGTTIKTISKGSGINLLSVFSSIADLHNAVSASDFSKINIGDYIDVPVNGTFTDAASNESKTISATVRFTVAGINHYIGAGTSITRPHVVLVSSVLPVLLAYNAERGVYYNSEANNAWTGSALYETLNGQDGIVNCIPTLTPYLFSNLTQRTYNQASGSAEITGVTNNTRVGTLFIPNVRELLGINVVLASTSNSLGTPQLPLFSASQNVRRGILNGSKTSYWIMGKDSVNYNMAVSSAGYVQGLTENSVAGLVLSCVFN